MATGQDILDRMHLLFPELQTASGGVDVARALLAANMAQDYLESVLALHPEIYGDSTGTIATIANQETTVFPAGVLRLDGRTASVRTSAPRALDRLIRETGGHAGASSVLAGLLTAGAAAPGRINGRTLFWAPVPDQVYQGALVRPAGGGRRITLVDPVAYPDVCLTPLANWDQILRTGLDDDTTAHDTLAKTMFEPVVTALAPPARPGGAHCAVLYSHDMRSGWPKGRMLSGAATTSAALIAGRGRRIWLKWIGERVDGGDRRRADRGRRGAVVARLGTTVANALDAVAVLPGER